MSKFMDKGKTRALAMIRRYLIAGLLVWIPLLVTIFVIRFIISLLDQSLALLPASLQPVNAIGWDIPGIGVILSLAILFFTGMLVTNFLGKKLFMLWNRFIKRIPIVRSIYAGVKQIMETIFSPGGQAFKQVLLVEYPRKGMWSIAFQTAKTTDEVIKVVGKEMVTIFIPTTPNPTSGFLMMVPRDEVTLLDMSVDQALKMVISLGVVQPAPGSDEKVIPAS
jgi:uncharacterized membrane protein